MTIGFLPALGSGIRSLAQTGQLSRLLDGYMRPYADAFGEVLYFSYLPESLEEFTSDPALLKRVRVIAPAQPMSRGRRALTMATAHADEFPRCRALRVFQITGTIPARRATKRFGIPYVTTYGFWYAQLSAPGFMGWLKRPLKARVETQGLRDAAAVIATTEELRSMASRFSSRVELIPNGVDTQLFVPAGTAPRSGLPRVLYVGRLSPEKNLEIIVHATSSLGAGATVTMIGAGPLRGDLEALARARQVEIKFPGIVEQAKLPAVYGAADVFVLASFTEGHPKVLLEAMACGVPCIASDCAGNRSLITDGETGLLFDPRRPDELAERLRQVLDDPALAARLGKAGRSLVAERYDLGILVQREIELVRSVARR
jgi:glycosyltransferase involved in cell wall biosynthesis